MERVYRGHPRFYELIDIIKDLHDRKNANYADSKNPLSNFQECVSFGVDAHMGTMVRMSDKWSRLKQLIQGKPDEVGESIKDTLMDLAVYSLLEIILIEEFEKEQSKKTIDGAIETTH